MSPLRLWSRLAALRRPPLQPWILSQCGYPAGARRPRPTDLPTYRPTDLPASGTSRPRTSRACSTDFAVEQDRVVASRWPDRAMFAGAPHARRGLFRRGPVAFTVANLRFRPNPTPFSAWSLPWQFRSIRRRPETTPLKTFNYSTVVKSLRQVPMPRPDASVPHAAATTRQTPWLALLPVLAAETKFQVARSKRHNASSRQPP